MEIYVNDNFASTVVRLFANYTRALAKEKVKFVTVNEETQASLGIETVRI